MKKKIVILVCVISLITTVGTFATLHISQEVKFNKMSKFEQMVAVMNKTVEDDLEFNNVLINYKYLEYGYKITEENMNYFADLIIDGYNPEEIMRCAYFWLDTDEKSSIVKDMCDWKDSCENAEKNEFWAERAFNAVTKEKCGVLTIEDLEEFERKGIKSADIMTANRLCRKGVYTIHEILKKFEEGMSMADIAIDIEGQAPFAKHTSAVSTYLSAEKSYPKASNDDIFESRHLAMLKNAPEQAFYNAVNDYTDIRTELEHLSQMLTDEIIDELQRGNYLRKRGSK